MIIKVTIYNGTSTREVKMEGQHTFADLKRKVSINLSNKEAVLSTNKMSVRNNSVMPTENYTLFVRQLQTKSGALNVCEIVDRINAIRRIFDSELENLLEQLSNLEENDQNEELKAQYDNIFGNEENIEW